VQCSGAGELRTQTQQFAERIIDRTDDYPPKPFLNVPAEDAPREIVLSYCHKHFPQFLPPSGPGISLKAARWLVYLHGLTNRLDKWCPDHNPLAQHHEAWRIAYAILLNEGYDISCLLATNIYGDNPGWVCQPNDCIILTKEHIPKTIEGLEALLESLVKNVRGKTTVPPNPNPTSCVFGPTSVPCYLQSANIFPIPKHGNSFQIVFDCKHARGRTVYTGDDVIIRANDSGGLTMVLLRPTDEARAFGERLNRAFNTLLPDKSTFKTSAVDYTDVKDLRHALRRWGKSSKISWIDMSSAYFNGKLSPVMQQYMGYEFGGMHFRFTSYSFGSAKSCLSFQALSSIVTLLCRALFPELFDGKKGIITNCALLRAREC
jgi:hypothetical protein